MKQPIHEVQDGLINTISGGIVDLLNPIPDMINITDIAHSLAHQCRFGGHVLRHYSVAQHCVMVAAMAPVELKKYALLHDASEAYLQDIIKPLKVIWGAAYKILEDRFMSAVAIKFNLDPGLFEQVKTYDLRALEIEHLTFQCGSRHEWQAECLSLNIPSTVCDPEQSKVLFLSTFYALFGSAFIN